MANWIYYENYQIPIFTVLLVLLWTVVAIRFWIFLQTFCGWRSYRGAATILITSTAALCTIYYGMMLAIFFVNQDMLKVRSLPKKGEKYPGGKNEVNGKTYVYRDPMNYDDDEVRVYIEHVVCLIKLIYANRFILTLGLYCIKFSFSTLFLETRTALPLPWQRFLYSTILLITITLLLSLWGIGKDLSRQLPALKPSPEKIRNGTSYRGARFILFDFDVELILNISNIITDLCLVAIAFKTVRAFRRPLKAVLFPCLLIGLCVSVALGRMALVLVTRDAPDYTSYATIPFELFAELETFTAVVVACIPGLRVAVRRRGEREERRKSGAGMSTREGGEVKVEMRRVRDLGVENWELGKATRWGGRGGRIDDLEGGSELESPRGSVFKPGGLMGRERIRSDGQVFLSGEEFLK